MPFLLTTQTDFRAVRDMPFCYICGEAFKAGDGVNHDHVPPKSMFGISDRNSPLKLAAHDEPCHSAVNLDDEIVGQLIALIHGKQPSERNDMLRLKQYQKSDDGADMACFDQRNIEFLMRRWLRGFHAALYRQPLDPNTRFAIQSPFPSGTLHDGEIVMNPIQEQHFKFVECIKKNRLAANLDVIESNNRKMRYECVWDKLSNGRWACIFALDVYGWKNLGDINNFVPRGCAGLYTIPDAKAPVGASVSTRLEFNFSNQDIADPFAV